MNIIPIDDPTDTRLDPYRNLRHEDVLRRGPLFIAEGRLVVKRLLQSQYSTASILAEQLRLAELESLVDEATPIYLVSQELIREVAGFNFHRGLLACGQRLRFHSIESLVEHCMVDEQGNGTLALAAISLNDLENLGSLLRTAAALGIFNIVLNSQTADPLCRRVLRVSMGAALKMRYFDLTDPIGWFEANQQSRHWQTIATTLAPDSIRLDEAARGNECKMIVMGNEGDGLPEAIQQACTIRAKIPMAPGIDSLNVAVAGAIALYEFTRSRR
jgi:tRNA G18 (ribose-2'-O)-methylase SpoU